MFGLLRRSSGLAGIAALGTIATFLVLEVTDVTSGRWRRELADGFERSTDPTWGLWLSAVVGLGLAVLGVVVVAAQFAPPKKGLNTMHEVHRLDDGNTRIAGRAAIRAATHELEQIDGVVDVAGTIAGKRLDLTMKVDDRANLTEVENEARERLGVGFWINLGLPDYGVNLLVTHHPKPPRVR